MFQTGKCKCILIKKYLDIFLSKFELDRETK